MTKKIFENNNLCNILDAMVFDSKSHRHVDNNGRLLVDQTLITKACVSEYYGKEIPNYEQLGLEPFTKYKVLRPAEELEKALPQFNNIPLLNKHIMDYADEPQKQNRCGGLSNATFKDGAVYGDLCIWDKVDIDRIESGELKDLSAGYRCEFVKESGEYNGEPYDLKMVNIMPNHLALVKKGRVDGAYVYDENKGESMFDKLAKLFKKLGVQDEDLEELKDEFKESDHPRAKDGKFTAGSGSNSGSSSSAKSNKNDYAKLQKHISNSGYNENYLKQFSQKEIDEAFESARRREGKDNPPMKEVQNFLHATAEGRDRYNQSKEDNSSKSKIKLQKSENGKGYVLPSGEVVTHKDKGLLRTRLKENSELLSMAQEQLERYKKVAEERKKYNTKTPWPFKETIENVKEGIDYLKNDSDYTQELLKEFEKSNGVGDNATPKEQKMEENKDKKLTKDAASEDKRKLIDEIGGILKGKVDEELIRTILGKAEKLAYEGSETSEADDEEPAKEDIVEETEEEKLKKIKDEAKEEAKKEMASLNAAKEEVEDVCGKIGTQDSKEAYYKIGCEALGLSTKGICDSAFEPMFKGAVAVKKQGQKKAVVLDEDASNKIKNGFADVLKGLPQRKY